MKLWGGNYSSDPDAAFWEFNRSFPFDRRLLVVGCAAALPWSLSAVHPAQTAAPIAAVSTTSAITRRR